MNLHDDPLSTCSFGLLQNREGSKLLSGRLTDHPVFLATQISQLVKKGRRLVIRVHFVHILGFWSDWSNSIFEDQKPKSEDTTENATPSSKNLKMMSGGPLKVISNAERQEIAQARIEAVKTRPSSLAAQEFFSGDRSWKSLPKRVQQIVDVFESWVR